MNILLLALTVFVVGWEAFWWIAGVWPIGPLRLKKMLQEPAGSTPLLVDVRTATEFRLFHIEGAENQPGLLRDPGLLDSLDKERPLVVVCLSGHRSPSVGFRLKKQGFKNVYYLSWGDARLDRIRGTCREMKSYLMQPNSRRESMLLLTADKLGNYFSIRTKIHPLLNLLKSVYADENFPLHSTCYRPPPRNRGIWVQ